MIKEFFKSGEFHICRFCGINIKHKVKKVIAPAAQRADGSWIPEATTEILEPNALFAHAEIPLRDGSKFRFNGCITCVSKVRSNDFMKICKNDANMLQYMYKSATRPKLAKCKVKCYDIKQIYSDLLKTSN